MRTLHAHHPVLCIVPPHILEHLARSRDPRLRALAEAALQSLLATERLRGQRDALNALATLAATPAGSRRRTVYDAEQLERLPGARVRGEGDPPCGDTAADEAYEGLGATYDLFFAAWGRRSIDGRGMRLDATVHFRERFNNAFWDGRQMVFGDGDGVIFARFTHSVDVIGHELAHGVTQHESGLEYAGEPGALNEHFSDAFGALAKQFHANQDAERADWLIGEGVFAPGIRGRALRSMSAPGTAYDDPRIGRDPQPAHMRDYLDTVDDNGGVHINSGIPNRAFCLAARALGGRAWERAGAVWYRALLERMRPGSTFADAAAATIAIAARDFGREAATRVRAAWKMVGVAPRAARRPREEAVHGHSRREERRTRRAAI